MTFLPGSDIFPANVVAADVKVPGTKLVVHVIDNVRSVALALIYYASCCCPAVSMPTRESLHAPFQQVLACSEPPQAPCPAACIKYMVMPLCPLPPSLIGSGVLACWRAGLLWCFPGVRVHEHRDSMCCRCWCLSRLLRPLAWHKSSLQQGPQGPQTVAHVVPVLDTLKRLRTRIPSSST